FQNKAVDDTRTLKDIAGRISGKKCLILAPGSSIIREKERIDSYVEKEKPVVISANFVPDTYQADYVFCCNAMRFEMLLGRKNMPELIVTSNLLEMCADERLGGRKPLVVNYTDLHFDEAIPYDNSVIMLLRLLKKLDVSDAALAGFDGYRAGSRENYVADYMASQHTKGEEENKRIKERMAQMEKQMNICYLTESLYKCGE
ncbi:MAG: 4-hydroxy-2-ketovalerate aldolase, partial [Acetatifactor sp.]|nr:4-hydroxy-2-ketovalerate aldolase [Acetatifactor sp.]